MIRGGIVTLRVSDVGRSIRFYVETLGMKLVEESADGSVVIDAGEGFRIGLREVEPVREADGRKEEVGASTSVGLYSKLPIDEAISIYENRGIQFGARSSNGASFRDPDGNTLTLFPPR